MLHRLSQRRLSVTNQRRVIIYGRLAMMPFRMAIAQVRPIVPYALANFKGTRLYAWAASWASYFSETTHGVLNRVGWRMGWRR